MFRQYTIALLAFGIAIACNNKKSTPAGAMPATPIERLMAEDGGAASTALKLCVQTWDETLQEFTKRFGAPTKVEATETRTTYTWAIVDGDRCAYFTADRGECPASWGKPGPRYNSGGSPVMTTKAGPNPYRSFEDCVALSRLQPVTLTPSPQ